MFAKWKWTSITLHCATVLFAAALGSAARAEEPNVTASASLGESGGRIAAEVRLGGEVDNPVKGNAYELYYQVRVHTKKGELGPILGTAESPTGKAAFVARKTAESKTLYFREEVDLTRGGLSGMTNFKPWGPVKPGYYEMVLRVEPHIYDVAQKKYISAAKTSAVILVAEVGDAGKVVRLQPLADLLVWSGTDGRDPTKYLAILADLDQFETLDNGIEAAFAAVLASKTSTPEVKLAFLKALPTKHVGSKSAHFLNVTLDELVKGDNPMLKAAAQKVLDDAKTK